MASISSLNIGYSANDVAQSTTIAPQSGDKPSQTPHQQDAVKLSEQAQVSQLYRQGESVSSIAAILSIGTTTVNGYLGITQQTEVEPTLPAVLKA